MKSRLFELTIGVYLPEGAPLPVTFQDWIDRMNVCGGATATYLERVVERRYPLADDVVERRRELGVRVGY
jgi:hypothetical protein